MTYDLVIRGGTVVDGTGAERFRADVAVAAGRLATIGAVPERGEVEIDASGMFVTPGFIDGHTHFDAQVFWDALGNCASLHGVTTCVMGNCGFTLAPTTADARDLAIRSIERAEDISRQDMATGVPWTWNTFAEYLDAVAALPKGINYAGYIGHSALRAFVMGERAFTDRATVEETARMRAEIRAALQAGAIGFSTSQLDQHRTMDDGPVASFVGGWHEVAALSGALADVGAGLFQVATDITDPAVQEELSRIAMSTGRPVHFPYVYITQRPEAWRDVETFLARIEGSGARAVGQVHVRELQNVVGFQVGLPYDRLPGWRRLRQRPLADQRAALLNAEQRAGLVDEALNGPYVTSSVAAEVQARLPDYDNLRALFTPTGERPSVSELARRRETTPVDVIIDLSLAADFNQFFIQPFANQDPQAVEGILRAPQTVIAQSDSGAHVSQIMDSSIPTYFLAHWVRERQVFTWEQAITLLTWRPAQVFGFPHRGVLREGNVADVVVFDPDRVAPCLPYAAHDLPAGGTRLVQEAEGIHATVVAGQTLLRDGKFTEARPGRLLRAGA